MTSGVSRGRLLILCGDFSGSLDRFDVIITWSPARHEDLRTHGITSPRFGDFTPSEERGVFLDRELHQGLEAGLDAEARANNTLRWAPLAIQQLRLPLARYRWLKECVGAIVRQYKPREIVLSSGEDREIVRAVEHGVQSEAIVVTVEHGPIDPSASTIYRSAPYGLPRRLDPNWFHRLRWRGRAWRLGLGSVQLELYPNIPEHACTGSIHGFKIRPALAFFDAVAGKLRRLLHIPHRETLVDLSSAHLDDHLPMIIEPTHWQQFSADEQRLLNGLLFRYFQLYPATYIDIVAERLAFIFSTIRPSRVVLAVDLLDADRLLAFVAKRQGIPVDYLPHGVVMEEYSGNAHPCLFVPNRILTWSEASADAFRALGWAATAIRHPLFNREHAMTVRSLPADRRAWRVLVLLSDWEGLSHAGREDGQLVEMMTIVRTLREVGIPSEHIDVKFHFTPIAEHREQQEQVVEQLKSTLDFPFRVIASSIKSRALLPEYSLVIVPPTTGIFEAVFLGIPLVLFGRGFGRYGIFRDAPLPHAETGATLRSILEQYDDQNLERVYRRLVEQVTCGVSLTDLPAS